MEDECIRQVSVLEDDRVTALVALELGAVLLDKGLSVQNPTLLATLLECSQVVLVYLVALGDSVALVRAASLVRGNAGYGTRGVDDGVLCCAGCRCPGDPPPERGGRSRLGRLAHRHVTRRGISENQARPAGGGFLSARAF